MHIKGKQNVVADALSRIPGSELLTSIELGSSFQTLGVLHVDDVPLKMQSADVSCAADMAPGFLCGIISINERETFRDKLIEE